MTTPPDFSAVGALVLDFDGPVCGVFAGLPAPQVADRLRAHLVDLGWGSGVELPGSDDPLQVLIDVYRSAPQLAGHVEGELQRAETEAVEIAVETPGARDLLHLLADAEVPVAIASNNSAPAVNHWLNLQDLDHLVQTVTGRHPTNVELMKPDPWPVLTACEALGQDPGGCLFVGDSLTDAQAAQGAGTPFVALATRREKITAFTDAGCPTVITSMTDMIDWIPIGIER